MRRWVAVAVALCATLAPLSRVPMASADDAATQAAKEIADARDRANAAADALFQAESRLDSLAIDQQNLAGEVAALQAKVDQLSDKVQQIALKRLTRSGSTTSPLLNGFATPQALMQVTALSAVVNETSAADFDNFDAANRDLAAAQDRLSASEREAQKQKADFETLKTTAEQEVQHLKEVEAERLKNEEIRKALQEEERRRARQRADELAKQQADAAAKANASTQSAGTPGASDSGSNDDGGGSAPQTTLPSNGASGGQTGSGGAGGRPGGAGGSDYGGTDWVCPTGDAAVSFGDTWGAPRSGGRRHQGVDMIGQRGTPVLAVVDGVAAPKTNTLGGTTIWFSGADGNKYYYAHLDSYGQLGAVSKGTVIGYMGDTGNAKFSVVHLHFEVHPGGGAAVNPYPTVRAHC